MELANPDFLWATVDVAIWSDIEQGLAITAGSMATLRPLYRKLSSQFGLSTGPDESSKPTGMRTPQWSPPISGRRQFPSFKSLLRTEKGTTIDREDEYGMGDLQPVRLRDDLVGLGEGESEKSGKGFTSWTIQAGKTSDEENRAGTITMQKQVHQESEQR
jgi:hypothetical protein